MSGEAALFRARGIGKQFAGVHALSGVDFELLPGEVHALAGENGAGKSTLIKLLGGVYPYGSYTGELVLDGQPCRFRSVRDAERAGIAVIHQELSLIGSMSVAENLCLGALPRRGPFVDWDAAFVHASAILERAGIDLDPAAKVEELGVGQRQLVEIARALGKNGRLLVLDEPSAALSARETQRLLELVRALGASGVACIYVSHKLPELFAITQRITVLRDGRSVATLDTARTDERELIAHMVGRELAAPPPRAQKPYSVSPRQERGEPVRLALRGLSVAPAHKRPPRLHAIEFELRAGEVLGVGGLLGAGRSELLLHLFGAFGLRTGGTVELDGKPFAPSGPRAALRAGVALVSEDRRRDGLFPEAGSVFNVSLSSLGRVRRGPFVDPDAEFALAAETLRELKLQPRALALHAGALSGGNQQKLVLARALLTRPRVLLLDEPTRGIDIGAKREVHDSIRELAARGTAILLCSSELDELRQLADRILMLREGRVGGVFEAGAVSEEQLLAAALGTAA